MSDNLFESLVRYRIDQSMETLEEAKLMRDAGHIRGAVNRAYYAMFYALQALLANRQLSTSKHSGVIAYFDSEFVKTGLFPKELSKRLHKLFRLRQDSDYGDMVELTQDQASLAIEQAMGFVEHVSRFLGV